MLLGAGCFGGGSSNSDNFAETGFLEGIPNQEVQDLRYDFGKLQIGANYNNCFTFSYYFTDAVDVTDADCDAAFAALDAGLTDSIDWSITEIDGDVGRILNRDGSLFTTMELTDDGWYATEKFWE